MTRAADPASPASRPPAHRGGGSPAGSPPSRRSRMRPVTASRLRAAARRHVSRYREEEPDNERGRPGVADRKKCGGADVFAKHGPQPAPDPQSPVRSGFGSFQREPVRPHGDLAAFGSDAPAVKPTTVVPRGKWGSCSRLAGISRRKLWTPWPSNLPNLLNSTTVSGSGGEDLRGFCLRSCVQGRPAPPS